MPSRLVVFISGFCGAVEIPLVEELGSQEEVELEVVEEDMTGSLLGDRQLTQGYGKVIGIVER